MRIRKNINCLSSNELHDLREAFAGIYQLSDSHPNSFATIAGLHGSPSPSYCIHANNGFFSWHRAYILELENALRTIHCNTTLPFWNWSSGNTVGVPIPCKDATYVNRDGATVSNPLFSGPKPASMGGGQTSRRSEIDTTAFGDLATTAQAAMTNTVWNNFVSDINSVHGSVHVRIGGDMSSVPTAGYDPIFYFHHCNIDRLWANWQYQNPITLPTSEANAVLEPFTRPYSNNWHMGIDFENTLDWDYQYRNWCIFLPPLRWPLERVLDFPIDPWVFDSRRIGVSLSSAMMPMHSFEVRVFANDKKASEKTKVEDRNYVGSIGVFGMGDAKMLLRKGQQFKLTLDITDQLRTLVKKNDKRASINLVPVYPQGLQMKTKEMAELMVELEVE